MIQRDEIQEEANRVCREQFRAMAEENSNLKKLLSDIIDDYDSTGCDACGVVNESVINEAREALGLGLLGEEIEAEDDGA